MTWTSVYGAQRACQASVFQDRILFYSILFYHITNCMIQFLKLSNSALHSDKKTTNKHCHSEILCFRYGSANSFISWISHFCTNKYQATFCCRGNVNRTLHSVSSIYCHLSCQNCHCQHIITCIVFKEYTPVIPQNTSTSTCFINFICI
jgi:hypothetical protein